MAFVSFIAFVPLTAPLFLAVGLQSIAKKIYFIYSFFCHQFSSRSLHLFDYQYAWCARDTGIWIGIMLTAFYVKFTKTQGIKWYWLPLFALPVALDGGIQTISTIVNMAGTSEWFYLSNNLTRFLTGLFLGIGVSLWVSPQLRAEFENTKGRAIKKFKVILTIFIAGFISYVFLIFGWNVTAKNIYPVGLFDNIPKISNKNFFARREDAPCSTNGLEDIIQIECFFK